MRYTVIDGFTVTGCPFKPDKFIGGFACAMCEHWKNSAHRISNDGFGESTWDVGCNLEKESRKNGTRRHTI